MPIVKTNLSGEDEVLSGGGSSVVVDTELSTESINPLANSTTTAKFNEVYTALSSHTEAISSLNTELSSLTLIFGNISVSTTSWISDATYTDYPYKADISCVGVTVDYVADVIFGVTEATSNNYAPVTLTGNSVVTIYAKEVPSANITIPTIKCSKVVNI